jgi:ribosome-associated toxin RatA of RatAB toxin-antitoxin module
VPAYSHSACISVAAASQDCFDALVDFERLPQWQRAVRRATVLERDRCGRGSVVAYEVDARVRVVRYTLRQLYDEPRSISSSYLEGDFRDFAGTWRFDTDASGRRTSVQLRVCIDPGRFVPGPLRALIARAVVNQALEDLESRFEERSHGA